MESELSYIFLGLLLLINIILVIVVIINRKKKVTINKPNNQESFKEETFYHDTSRSDKTELLSPLPKKASMNKIPVNITNKEVKIESIPKLDNLKKSELQNGVILKDNKKIDIDSTEIEGTEFSEENISNSTDKKKVVYGTINYREDGSNVEFVISRNLINIGRDPQYCDVVISEDSYIGRNHALIYVKNSELFFVDLNSKNGSFCNGERILGQLKIEEDTIIKVAYTEILVKVGV